MTYKPLQSIPKSALATDVQAALEAAASGGLAPAAQVNFVSASGTTQTLPDPTLKPINRIIVTANLALTFPTPGLGRQFDLFLQRDTVGGWKVTFPSVRWAGELEQPQSTGANEIDWYRASCPDGTTWIVHKMESAFSVPLGQPTTSLMLDQIGVTAAGAYSLRKVRATYTGAAIRVQRASDATEQDIGFTSAGDLNTAALATFCSGTTGYVKTWYDQSGSGNNMATPLQANMMRIYNAGATETQNGKPVLVAADATRGIYLTAALTTNYAGNTLSGAVIGTLKSATTSFSPRYLSAWGASSTDNGDSQGAHLIGRNGGATPSQQWAINRAGAARTAVAGQFDVLQQVDAVVNEPGSSYSIAADGNQSNAFLTISTFAINRWGVGYTGSGYQSVAGEQIAEFIIWHAALSDAQRTILRNNQKTYYGTGTTPQSPSQPSAYTGTLIVRDNWETGAYSASNYGTLNNSAMTNNGGAWMSDMVRVNSGALELGVKLDATAIPGITARGGGTLTTRKRGGYVGWWSAPGATRRGGVWRWSMQVPGASLGWGFVPLLWPQDDVWPDHGEIDGPPELFSGNANKSGGECFIHWSTNSGTGGFNGHIQKRVPGSGSFGVDWTQRHTCAVAWNPGSDTAGTGAYIKFFIDDVLAGQILATDAADSSGLRGVDYIPHGTSAVPMQLRFQTEGYGTAESSTAAGPLWWRIFWAECWSLPS